MSIPKIGTLTPELTDALKQRSDAVLRGIVKANSQTIYFQESPLLACLHEKLMTCSLADVLQVYGVVPLSVDKDYAPFIARFNDSPCRASRVRDLLAPGFPKFLAHASGTTDGPKIFPKYRHTDIIPTSGGRACWIFSCRITQIVDIISDNSDGKYVGLPICFGIGGMMRIKTGVGFTNDRNFMSQRLANITSPFAAYLIQPYQSILLIHGLFALADRCLSEIVTTFGVLFYDFVRLLVENWHLLVEAIRSGRLPNVDGLGDVAFYLQAQLRPDPHRAAELRDIDVGPVGWLKKVWPQLKHIKGIFSGSYGTIVSKIRHHTGPSISLISTVYISTECYAGSVYDTEDLDVFKINSDDFVEYLDVEKSETSADLCQAWELRTGVRYELVITNHDGRWRYRLGDVLEAVGFDPIDGQPLMRYIERRILTLRVGRVIMTEQELRGGICSLKKCLGDIVEFTIFVDDRCNPHSYGFIVELGADLGPMAKDATSRLHLLFSADNQAYRGSAARGFLRKPSIRIVASGTFQHQYHEWKFKTNKNNCRYGQLKMPVIIHDTETKEWLLQRVVSEL